MSESEVGVRVPGVGSEPSGAENGSRGGQQRSFASGSKVGTGCEHQGSRVQGWSLTSCSASECWVGALRRWI